jgi:hypothetical protein
VSGYGYHSWLNHFFSEVSNPYLPAMLTKALLSGCPFTVFFPRHLAEILWLNNSFPDEASHGIVFPPLTFQVNYWPSSFSTDCPAMNFFSFDFQTLRPLDSTSIILPFFHDDGFYPTTPLRSSK